MLRLNLKIPSYSYKHSNEKHQYCTQHTHIYITTYGNPTSISSMASTRIDGCRFMALLHRLESYLSLESVQFERAISNNNQPFIHHRTLCLQDLCEVIASFSASALEVGPDPWLASAPEQYVNDVLDEL